jgi:hypothetical protein
MELFMVVIKQFSLLLQFKSKLTIFRRGLYLLSRAMSFQNLVRLPQNKNLFFPA